MSEYTPGPWGMSGRCYELGDGLAGINGQGWNELAGVVIKVNGRRSDEGIANARLIAAAPDLLEALQEMVAGDAEAIEDAKRLGVPFPDEMLAAYHKARAAIARATGERP